MAETLPGKFKRPDQLGGMVLVGLAIAIPAALFIYFLDTLITLAENTLYLGVMVAVGVVAAMFLLDPGFWRNVYYWSQNQTRTMRRLIVREDPIGILTTVIKRFETKLVEISDSMVQADGARKRQANAIRQMEQKGEAEKKLADAAVRMSKADSEVAQHGAASDRWMKAANEMRPMADMLDKMQLSLEQARDLCQAKLDDLCNQKDVLAIKLETMKSSQAAVKRFKMFFGSNPDLDMQITAVEEVERQSTEAEAEIDQFMRQIAPALQTADLAKQAAAQDALAKFGRYAQQQALPESSPVLDAHVISITTKEKVR